MVSTYFSLHSLRLLFTLGMLLAAAMLVLAGVLLWRRFGVFTGLVAGMVIAVPVVVLAYLGGAGVAATVDSLRAWPEKYALAQSLGVDPLNYPEPPGFWRFPAHDFKSHVQPGMTRDEVVATLNHTRARYRCETKHFPGYIERYVFLSERADRNQLIVRYDSNDQVVRVDVVPPESGGFAPCERV